jgi:hypothetical protein
MCPPPLSPCACGGKRFIVLDRRQLVVTCQSCGARAVPPKEPPPAK